MRYTYVLMFFTFFFQLAHAQDRIIISEIMYDTPLNERLGQYMDYSNGEFIELYNAGELEVYMGGWTLKGGGKTEIVDLSQHTLLPGATLIIAYQHSDKNTVELFQFKDFYTSYTINPPERDLMYQRKLLLSNSGESITLKDQYGITRDSIFYDGTSNKRKKDRLEAFNEDDIASSACHSLQRIKVEFDDNIGVTDNSHWVTALVTPLSMTNSFENIVKNPFLNSELAFYYDNTGNEISRTHRRDGGIAKQKTVHVDQKDSIEISDQEILGLIAYPNPTYGPINLEWNEIPDATEATLVIYNQAGKPIQQHKCSDSRTVLDIERESPGIYILRLEYGRFSTTAKIIKY